MSNTSQTDTGRRRILFAAVDPYIQRNIPKPVESQLSGREGIIRWGRDNRYPDYLLDLYNNVATLRSVINGCADYIAGDDAAFLGDTAARMNRAGDVPRDIVRLLGVDFKRTGAFALQVIRDATGAVAEVYYIDLRFLRWNKDATAFWYSERWGRSNPDPILMPAFLPDLAARWGELEDGQRAAHVSSIYLYKEDRTQVYPSPCYRASIPSCEIERNIDDFHLNALENGFTASAVINFNNGVPPSDEEKEEIERNINEKFSGHENAARILVSFNDSKDVATTIDEFKVEDFGDRYKALESSSRQKIFTAFRAHPALFGIPTQTDSLNLASEDYEIVFKMFNRTQVRPAQRAIADAFDRIYGQPGVLTITPFSLDGTGETNVK